MTNTPTDSGDVSIPFGDSEATLICSLAAAKRVNAVYGNFVAAISQVRSFNMDAFAAIVGAAMDKKPADVELQVYAAGMEALEKPLVTFLANLTNGGKPMNSKIDEDKKSEGKS